ncbi:MAG: hypothetical protein HUU16_14500 [Candidatus Omnitrophica bacterium]|nr:hypothetical protein [Candidatus Omnitrophota bacterium]
MEWPRVDRTKLTFASLDDPSDEKEYRSTKTVEERLQAVEMMRRMAYGEGAVTARLQRVLEIVERSSGGVSAVEDRSPRESERG